MKEGEEREKKGWRGKGRKRGDREIERERGGRGRERGREKKPSTLTFQLMPSSILESERSI